MNFTSYEIHSVIIKIDSFFYVPIMYRDNCHRIRRIFFVIEELTTSINFQSMKKYMHSRVTNERGVRQNTGTNVADQFQIHKNTARLDFIAIAIAL